MRRVPLWVVSAFLLMQAIPAQAAVLSVVPSASTIAPGGAVAVDIVISDLGDGVAPSLGTFDLNLDFDPATLGFVSATFGNQLDILGLGSLQGVDDSVAGTVNVFELSFDSASDLNDLQAASFTLVTLTFTALAGGLSDLLITILSLGDADGAALDAGIVNASVTVNDSAVIPLPGALPLLLSGLAALGFFSRRRRSLAP